MLDNLLVGIRQKSQEFRDTGSEPYLSTVGVKEAHLEE